MGLKEWLLNFLNVNIIVVIIITFTCCMDEWPFSFPRLRMELLLNSMSVIIIILVTTCNYNIKEQPLNFTQRKELLLYPM